MEHKTADYLRDAGLGTSDHERELLAKAAELSWKIEQAEKSESAFLAKVTAKPKGSRKPSPATNEPNRERVEVLTKKLLAWTGWVDDPRERATAIIAELEKSEAGRLTLRGHWRTLRDWIRLGGEIGLPERHQFVRFLGGDSWDVTIDPLINAVFRACNALDPKGMAGCEAYFAAARAAAEGRGTRGEGRGGRDGRKEAGAEDFLIESLSWRELGPPPKSADAAWTFLLRVIDDELGRIEALDGAEEETGGDDDAAFLAEAELEGPRREVAAMSRELMEVLDELCRLRKEARHAASLQSEPAEETGAPEETCQVEDRKGVTTDDPESPSDERTQFDVGGESEINTPNGSGSAGTVPNCWEAGRGAFDSWHKAAVGWPGWKHSDTAVRQAVTPDGLCSGDEAVPWCSTTATPSLCAAAGSVLNRPQDLGWSRSGPIEGPWPGTSAGAGGRPGSMHLRVVEMVSVGSFGQQAEESPGSSHAEGAGAGEWARGSGVSAGEACLSGGGKGGSGDVMPARPARGGWDSMPEMSGRTSTKLEPEQAWTILTEAPLKGMAFAYEAGRIVAWDEGGQLYLLNAQGETLSISRVPQAIVAGAVSAEGSLIALVGEGSDGSLVLLNADFEIEAERPAPSEATFLAIDPHGRYVAVGTRSGAVNFLNRYGGGAGRLETIQPIAHLAFVPDRPFLIGAAAFGMLVGVELADGRGAGRLDPELAWQDRLLSNVGRLTVSGDGSMVLASCFTHGIQRFDLNGRNEGSYHLGGTVSHAVPDFPGRTIAAATLEGELAIMNSAGNVRWRTHLARPPIALEIDPLGRYVLYGHSTGEIVRLDLFGAGPGSGKGRSGSAAGTSARAGGGGGGGGDGGPRTTSGSVRRPDWTVRAVSSDEQAETAVMAVTEDPACVAMFTSPHKLELFSTGGERLGKGPEMTGVGRILRSAPGWLAAATDRSIVLVDLRRSTQRRVDVSLVELTHLAIRPDSFGLATVQERDRVGRVTPSGRWIWKRELRSPVEDLAIGPEGFAALTTNAGELMVFDPAGEPSIGATFDPSDPPLLIEAPEATQSGVVWITLGRRSQTLSGHDLRGKILWSRGLSWEGWSLCRAGPFGIAAAADGRVQAFDRSGTVRAEGGASGTSNDVFTIDERNVPLRIVRKGVHLICTSFDGRVRWRAVGEETLGPFAAGPAGVAALVGQSLAWFATALK
ncbi:lactonase family protein [Aquisphaera insulae]|uniref:lactonase family protein n=1 Tax=Aquisphaera insulae TaxID=2712864 RepID=UPI00202E65C7|nr:lactonase family protein [Aquisphaera insulae]